MKIVASAFRNRFMLGFICLSFALRTSTLASPTVYTFDDVPAVWPWQNPYGGLNWNNFLAENVPSVTAQVGGPSGYQAGLISPQNVVYNSAGTPASISRSGAFDFLSAYMTAAVMDNLQFEVKGYLNGSLKYDNTYTLSATAPTLIHFNYFGVDTVNLSAFGGTFHGYAGFAPGEVFAMDNLTVDLTPVPEPAEGGLFVLSAMAMVLFHDRRAKRRSHGVARLCR